MLAQGHGSGRDEVQRSQYKNDRYSPVQHARLVSSYLYGKNTRPMTITTEMAHIGKSWWRKTLDLPEEYFHCWVLLKAGPCPASTAHGQRHTSQPAARRPYGAQPMAEGPVAHFTVHIPWSSLEFLSAVFYSACSDLCSKMEEGEFWFLCNFHRFNPLQSLYLFVALCSRNKR